MDKLISSIFLIFAITASIQNASGSALRYPQYGYPNQYYHRDLLPTYEDTDLTPVLGYPKSPCRPAPVNSCNSKDYYIPEQTFAPYVAAEVPQVVMPPQLSVPLPYPVALPPSVPCPRAPTSAAEVLVKEKPVYSKPGGATAFSTINVFPSPPIILPEMFPYAFPASPPSPPCPCQSPPTEAPSQIFYIQEIDIPNPEPVKACSQNYYY